MAIFYRNTFSSLIGLLTRENSKPDKIQNYFSFCSFKLASQAYKQRLRTGRKLTYHELSEFRYSKMTEKWYTGTNASYPSYRFVRL